MRAFVYIEIGVLLTFSFFTELFAQSQLRIVTGDTKCKRRFGFQLFSASLRFSSGIFFCKINFRSISIYCTNILLAITTAQQHLASLILFASSHHSTENEKVLHLHKVSSDSMKIMMIYLFALAKLVLIFRAQIFGLISVFLYVFACLNLTGNRYLLNVFSKERKKKESYHIS